MSEATDRPKFVVGLGNPGREYAATRHNVGFRVAKVLQKRWAAPAGRWAFSGEFCDVRVSRGANEARVMLLQPQTYMNRSGLAVRQMVDFYKAAPNEVLIVLDDMALPVGRLRARADGSAGGHNGLSDILAAMGTPAVARVRIGIGQPPGAAQWKDFVLSGFSAAENELIAVAIDQAADAVEDWVFRGIDYVMEKYNKQKPLATSD